MTADATLATMRPDPDDPNIQELTRRADTYHQAKHNADQARALLDAQVQAMKAEDYSYPTLAKIARLAQGTIQNIIAKGEAQA